jgi:hypothetical protein
VIRIGLEQFETLAGLFLDFYWQRVEATPKPWSRAMLHSSV